MALEKSNRSYPNLSLADEKVYEIFFNQGNLGFCLIDPDFYIVKSNEQLGHMLGVSDGGLIGSNLKDYMDDSQAYLCAKKAKKLNNGEIRQFTVENTFHNVKGLEIFAKTHLRGNYKEDQLLYVSVFVHDISDLKRKESELIGSEKRVSLFFDKSPVGIMVLDLETNTFQNVNQAIIDMLGYKKDELLSLNLIDISPPLQPDGSPSKETIMKNVERTIRGEKLNFEWVHMRKDGTKRLFEITLDQIEHANGKLTCIGIMLDITEKRHSERSLKESEQRFKTLFQYNPLMIFAVQEDGTILSVNQAVEDQLGYEESALLGAKVNMIFHPEDQQKITSQIQQFTASKEISTSWELRKITKHGDIMWVREFVRYIDWPAGDQILLITCENVSQQKQTELILRKNEERYRSVFENDLFGMAMLDNKNNFLMVNKTMQIIFGLDRSKFRNSNALPFQNKAAKDRFEKALKDLILRKKKHVTFDAEFIKNEVDPMYARIYFSAISENNQYSHTLFILEDITEQILLEAKEKILEKKQAELDHKNRELASYTLFLTQKNQLLNSISSSLEKLSKDLGFENRDKVKKLQNYIYQNRDQEKDWKSFQLYFQEINPDFFSDLQADFNNLTQNELKHCAYIKMKLSIKEVATLLHISPKAVEIARYRIKKKLGLQDRFQKLSAFLERY